MKINIKLVREGAQMPRYATKGAAAADLCAVCGKDGITLEAGGRALIPTGIAIELPSANYAAFVYARSGLAVKHGISLSNGVGVIDSDYRGEISVGLVNLSNESYTIQNGERIAQLCIQPVVTADFAETDNLSDTTRGEGGFGSTGKV